MSENTKKWYVVRAISGKEKKVKEFIESEIKAIVEETSTIPLASSKDIEGDDEWFNLWLVIINL